MQFVFCKYALKLLNMPQRLTSKPEDEFTQTEKLLSKRTEGFIHYQNLIVKTDTHMHTAYGDTTKPHEMRATKLAQTKNTQADKTQMDFDLCSVCVCVVYV